jgi:hypothetical protein
MSLLPYSLAFALNANRFFGRERIGHVAEDRIVEAVSDKQYGEFGEEARDETRRPCIGQTLIRIWPSWVASSDPSMRSSQVHSS